MSALRDAYELIKDEDRWTQGMIARDAHGDQVLPWAPEAVRWCASGAVLSFPCSFTETDALVEAANALFPQFRLPKDFHNVVEVNDMLGHAAILQVFEKAIVELEGSL